MNGTNGMNAMNGASTIETSLKVRKTRQRSALVGFYFAGLGIRHFVVATTSTTLNSA